VEKRFRRNEGNRGTDGWCFADFFESVYLPWINENRRPSTYKNCRDVWKKHVRTLSIRERHCLKDIRTFTVQRWLNQIGEEDLSRNSLKRIKSTLSGAFTIAKQLGYFDGVNPAQGTSIGPRAREGENTHAYSLEEVNSMITLFPNLPRQLSRLPLWLV
jgi:hypothetical protein